MDFFPIIARPTKFQANFPPFRRWFGFFACHQTFFFVIRGHSFETEICWGISPQPTTNDDIAEPFMPAQKVDDGAPTKSIFMLVLLASYFFTWVDWMKTFFNQYLWRFTHTFVTFYRTNWSLMLIAWFLLVADSLMFSNNF